MYTDKEEIYNYFAKYWPGGSGGSFEYSNNLSIAERIPADATVIDVGCGYNLLKAHLGERLYAFDPAIDCGDELTDIESFDPKGRTWDVALCMGSLNFGTEETVKSQIEKVVKLVKPGGLILWRQNPGQADHEHEECKNVPFFNWTVEKNYEYAALYNCEVKVSTIEYNITKDRIRIYSEWIKNDIS